MARKSATKRIEDEMAVVIEAIKLWPEMRDQYITYLAFLNGKLGRTKRAARVYKAKAVHQSYAHKAEMDRDYRRAMERDD